jgi:hypothetical protein
MLSHNMTLLATKKDIYKNKPLDGEGGMEESGALGRGWEGVPRDAG